MMIIENLQYDIDEIIVLAFFGITLLVGLIAGKGVKNIKDYAIANKSYGTPILLLTLLATQIGGGATIGDTAQIFNEGILYSIALLGYAIGAFFLAYFIAPKFDRRFDGMLSICDMVKHFYGYAAEKISAIIGSLVCIGLLGVQLTAMGNLTAHFLNISYLAGIFITSFIMLLYSTFGGIRSVTITDVFHFIILIVMFPLVIGVAVNKAGGLENILYNMEAIPQLQTLEHVRFWEYFALFTFFMLPFGLLQPYVVQRYLMSQNPKQIVNMTYIYSILLVALAFMVTCIAFAALQLYPNIEPKAIIPTIINDHLPPIIKGLAISGMLAVIMSTADSALNSAGILLAHNLLPDKLFKSEINKLRVMKLCTLIIGILGIIIALKNYNISSLFVLVQSLSLVTFGIPLTFAIVGFKVDARSFWVSNFFALSAFVSAHYMDMPEFLVPILSTVIGLVSFFATHWLVNDGFIFINIDKADIIKKKVDIVTLIKKYTPTPYNVFSYSKTKVEKFGADHMMFAIFCCINYMIPYFMWPYKQLINYPVILEMRLITGLLCVGLLLKEYWPKQLKKYFPIYWHFTLIFCIPFVITVMFFMMNADIEWLINLTLSIMLLIMLVDWISFIFIALIGIALGYIFYRVVIGIPVISMNFGTIYLSIYVCVFATLIGVLFARRKEINIESKIDNMQLFGGAIAHEVKSPLATISMCVQHQHVLLQKALKSKESDGDFYSLKLNQKEFDYFIELSHAMKNITKTGIKIVDDLLVALKSNVITDDKAKCSISACLNQAMQEYNAIGHLKKIYIDVKQDFEFFGSLYYTKHILFNLLDNAYRYGGKDIEINIWTENNKLYFRDHGIGILPEHLPHIFDKFYTKAKTGTGIGLAFCKMIMEDIGGSIRCKSELGKYTEFTLYFPNIERY